MPRAAPLLGCIADDFTGATDLANMLVRGGMRTVQTIGVPRIPDAIDADALIVALKSRTIDAAEAVAQALAALAWLRAQGCRQFFFKYCSTFDSTGAGNIGPVTEALLDALKDLPGSDFTIACPAFPENGRTLYCGHLFVGDVLLNESGMQNHPLTPMTDPNLMRVLQKQTHSKIGLVRHDMVAKGPAAVRAAFDTLRAEHVRIAIADAVSNADLYTLGEACSELALITGGSGVALGLPASFRSTGRLAQAEPVRIEPIDGPAVVLAGSASRATSAQVAAWRASRPSFRIDPLAIARGEAVVEQAVSFAHGHFSGARPQPVLIYATTTPEAVKAAQRELGVARAGQLVEEALADVARELHALGVRKFVVAGGETSGAVVQALGVQALRIGAQIDPGVPATVSTGERPLALALKSGNFGAADFFSKALGYLDEMRP
ncbi:3-oxo-tetronate kinase [Paraburkholderia sp.]|uniref:3-oxo-tetronate kinase n=1 Tax=Paraburkholderia sp. TaxID=1926495 RepID=UPI0039E29D43